jgi:Fe-S oxidoreductase
MALANIEILNEVSPKRITTTCPHCLHTIKNEYPAFGGHYEVIHHTELISELVASGKLELKQDDSQSITFHDPCYLGRQNDILAEPRRVLEDLQAKLIEMPRHGNKSFCCGAGGAQMWKEEEHGDARVNAIRFEEAKATGANTLAVGCPFCMVMLNDAKVDSEDEMQVLDVAEIVAQAMEENS